MRKLKLGKSRGSIQEKREKKRGKENCGKVRNKVGKRVGGWGTD